MAGDIFDCHDCWGEVVLLAPGGVETRDANILQPHRRAHTTKGYPAPNAHSAKAEYRASLQYSTMHRLTFLKHPFPKLMASTG